MQPKINAFVFAPHQPCCQLMLQAVQTGASWHIWKIVNISSYNILITKHAVESVG